MPTIRPIFRRFLFALLLAVQAMVLSLSAIAAEITFYEYAGFGGQSLTLRRYTPDFSEIGFNDRASSIVVTSGRWEVCTDAHFAGTCVTLGRGEYRQLESRLDGRISSAREVGAYGSERGAYTRYGRGSIELFEAPGFRGPSVRLDRDVVNFESLDFNDRAGSAIVHEGTWELCVGSDYRGTCRTYAGGRYPDLGPGMSKLVSSARLVSSSSDAPVVIGGSAGSRPVPPSSGGARLILYEYDRFNGRSMALTENVVDFANTGFNDRAASAVVESGYWEVCSDAFFRGQCRVLGPGRTARLDGAVYQTVSSARVVSGPGRPEPTPTPPPIPAPAPIPTPPRADMTLYEHDNYAGRHFDVRGDVPDLDGTGFNDLTSSIVVLAGQWEVCTDAYYRGRCVVYGPGRYPSLLGLNDVISSVRRVRR